MRSKISGPPASQLPSASFASRATDHHFADQATLTVPLLARVESEGKTQWHHQYHHGRWTNSLSTTLLAFRLLVVSWETACDDSWKLSPIPTTPGRSWRGGGDKRSKRWWTANRWAGGDMGVWKYATGCRSSVPNRPVQKDCLIEWW